MDENDPHFDFNPDAITVRSFALAGLPICLASPRRLVSLGSGFESTLAQGEKDPWKPSALKTTLKDRNSVEVDLQCCNASSKESCVFSSAQSSEQFSGSLKGTIGNSLVSGSVSGTYDKAVSESHQV
jgi:hypothetical protein